MYSPPTQAEIDEYIETLGANKGYSEPKPEHELRNIITKHGSSMDGATWYATKNYLKQIKLNKEVQEDETGFLRGERSRALGPIAEAGRKNSRGSMAHAEWQAFLDKNGYDYD